MSERVSLIAELEDAIARGSSARSAETINRLTDLFTGRSADLNDQHVELFDDVISRLVGEIETKARAELARRLAPIDNAPPNTIRQLAHDESIEVAGPVLLQSKRLDDADLVDIARHRGQGHLLAISARRPLADTITDVLVDRGDEDVLFNVASNSDARFSPGGYERLVVRAEGDDSLMTRIGERPDIPPHLFRQLVMKASAIVQRKLAARAPRELRAEIERVLSDVSLEIDPAPTPHRFTAARRLIGMLHDAGALGESELYDLAKSKRYEETVAALALLCNVTVEQIDWLMNGDRIEPLLIHLKAAGFDWLTVRALVLLRPSGRRISARDLEDICDDFKRLSYATARRVVGHLQSADVEIRAAS
jgi:uncharacterized protein (DUF2336 family)